MANRGTRRGNMASGDPTDRWGSGGRGTHRMVRSIKSNKITAYNYEKK